MDADDAETVKAHDRVPSMLSTRDKLEWMYRKLTGGGRSDNDRVTLSELQEAIEHAQLPQLTAANLMPAFTAAADRRGTDSAAGRGYGSRS